MVGQGSKLDLNVLGIILVRIRNIVASKQTKNAPTFPNVLSER